MVDHLRMSYPVSLSQLLTEGPFNDCLNSFIYDSGEHEHQRVCVERDLIWPDVVFVVVCWKQVILVAHPEGPGLLFLLNSERVQPHV